MKNIIIALFCFFSFAVSLDAQYSIPLRLVNSSGAPLTGQAANIIFTRYPHTYGVDDVSGITVTEIGTAGNYRCRGFTTYEYVKLWLSGSEQTWFDSVQVGSITSYLSSNYMNKTGTQTGFTGTKTLTGDWLWTAGTVTMNKPYIYTSSPWYTDYSLLSNSSIGWKGLNDSLYVPKSWMFLNSTKITLQSGYLIWGLGNTTPIKLDESQLRWSTTSGLQLVNSLAYDSVVVREDTIISEGTYYKIWSIHRNQWSEIDSLRLWITYYNTYANTRDSSQLINNVSAVDNETSVSLQYDGSVAKIDSVYLQVGTYMIDFGMLWERPDHSNAGQIGIADTVILALKEQSSAPNTYLVNNIRDIHTYLDTNNLLGSELSWSTTVTISSPKYIYLYGKYLATALSNAIGSGPTASVKRGRIIATLIR